MGKWVFPWFRDPLGGKYVGVSDVLFHAKHEPKCYKGKCE